MFAEDLTKRSVYAGDCDRMGNSHGQGARIFLDADDKGVMVSCYATMGAGCMASLLALGWPCLSRELGIAASSADMILSEIE